MVGDHHQRPAAGNERLDRGDLGNQKRGTLGLVNSGFMRPQDRIVINLAPAELPKQAGGVLLVGVRQNLVGA
jgi:hypothetical protein